MFKKLINTSFINFFENSSNFYFDNLKFFILISICVAFG